MPLISPPRCPVCQAAVNAADLRREGQRRQYTLFSEKTWGIRCPACRTTLKVRWWPVHLISVSFIVLLIASFSFVPALAPRRGTVMFFAIVYVGALVTREWWAPLFARLERPSPHEEIAAEKTEAERIAEDPEYREELEELDELNGWRDKKVREAPVPAWRCKACGEENPGTFELCWKCQKEK